MTSAAPAALDPAARPAQPAPAASASSASSSPSASPATWRRRLAVAMHWLAVAIAVTALPMQLFSPLWLLLFCLPGVVFLGMSRPQASARIGFAERLGIALALEVALAFCIYQTAAIPLPQAALTYLLLAPLAYSTLRRRDLDVLHSLFLAFCLLLIGAILRRQVPLSHVLAFVLCAALVLQEEARRARTVRAVATRVALASARGRLLRRCAVAVACAMAFLGAFEALRSLPSPAATHRQAAAQRAVGLSAQFDLDGSRLGPLRLIDDELVRITVPGGGAPPDNLYLRCGYFDRAGLDRWRVFATKAAQQLDVGARAWLAEPVARAPVQRLEVERLEGLSGFVYVPPGTFRLQQPAGAPLRLLLDPTHQLFREPTPGGPIRYSLYFQNLRAHAARGNRRVRLLTRGLSQLPREIQTRRPLVELAAALRGAAQTPYDIADNIARGLRARCTYALEDPRGDSPHALENFLFGDRRGFCMHFASAMAILLRLNHVPCRIAVGLFGGRPAAGDNGEDFAGRVFGSRHAHAWVELPFEGLGWVVIDPTPEATLRARSALMPTRDRDAAPSDAGEIEADGAPAPGPHSAAAWLRRAQPWWPWLALLVLAGGALFRPARRTSPTRAATAPPGVDREARRLLDELLAELARHDHPRPRGASLEQLAAGLAAAGVLDPADLAAVEAAFRAYQEVRFGGRPLSGPRRGALRAGIDAAARADAAPRAPTP